MMYWVLAVFTIISGVSAVWYFWDKIAAWLRRKPVPPKPEFPVSRETSRQMRLEQDLTSQGYRLVWGATRNRELNFMFGDYEQIPWTDQKGQNWVLGPAPGGDIPMRTKFTSDEIEARKKERVKGRSNNGTEPIR
jgi:hypothetical protein